MDRRAFARCAFVVSSLVAALTGGCESHEPQAVSQAPRRPAILADLQQASPGPWRRLREASVAAAAASDAPGDSAESAPASDGRSIESVNPSSSNGDPTDVLPDAATLHEVEDAPVAGAESTLEWAGMSSQSSGPPPAGDVSPSAPADEKPAAPSESNAESQVDMPLTSLAPGPEPPSAAPDPASADKVVPDLLPWAGAQVPSPEAVAALRRADEDVRRGFQLSGRGALYSARKQYIAALQLIAQSNDARQSTRFFSKALASGLCALEESSDFVRLDPRKGEADLAAIVARHRTPVLKEDATDSLTMSSAARRYRIFAQEQLAVAAAGEIPGSMALFGLAKSTMAANDNGGSRNFERVAEVMVLYEAALLADPRNHHAANELGVLLAENGNLARARDLLAGSARGSSQAATWHNLAVVHARLGEMQLATAARAQAAACRGSGQVTASANVQWVDPSTFASTSPMGEGLLGPALPPKAPNPAPVATSAEKPAVTTAKKSIADWLPWSTRR